MAAVVVTSPVLSAPIGLISPSFGPFISRGEGGNGERARRQPEGVGEGVKMFTKKYFFLFSSIPFFLFSSVQLFPHVSSCSSPIQMFPAVINPKVIYIFCNSCLFFVHALPFHALIPLHRCPPLLFLLSPVHHSPQCSLYVHAMANPGHTQVQVVLLCKRGQVCAINLVVQKTLPVLTQVQITQPISHVVLGPVWKWFRGKGLGG